MSDASTSDAGASPAVMAIERLRQVGKVEGVSYLLLLGVAMPLKYLAHLPIAVKIVGWAHGVLFVAFLFVLWRAWKLTPLSLQQALAAFIASLLPFGPFLIDRRLDAIARQGRLTSGKPAV